MPNDQMVEDLDIQKFSRLDDLLCNPDVVRIYMENLFDTLVLNG